MIIADIRLPDMTGYELLLKLQEMMDPVPLVLMTGFGYDPGHSIVKARQARLPLYAVLYKPFRLDQLLDTVERIVRPERDRKPRRPATVPCPSSNGSVQPLDRSPRTPASRTQYSRASIVGVESSPQRMPAVARIMLALTLLFFALAGYGHAALWVAAGQSLARDRLSAARSSRAVTPRSMRRCLRRLLGRPGSWFASAGPSCKTGIGN